MYFSEDFFFPKVLFLGQQTIYLLLAHTELLKSFALVFFLIILLHRPRAPLCAAERRWHFHLSWISRTYWKLLKQLFPTKIISRIFYSKDCWRVLGWWLIDTLLSKCWSPPSADDESCPSQTSNFKRVCTLEILILKMAFLFLETEGLHLSPGMPLVWEIKDSNLHTGQENWSQVCFQRKRTMQEISSLTLTCNGKSSFCFSSSFHNTLAVYSSAACKALAISLGKPKQHLWSLAPLCLVLSLPSASKGRGFYLLRLLSLCVTQVVYHPDNSQASCCQFPFSSGKFFQKWNSKNGINFCQLFHFIWLVE